MRNLIAICCVVGVIVITACAPAEPPPAAEPTPAAASDDTIGTMDFESGEAENAATETVEEGSQATPVHQ